MSSRPRLYTRLCDPPSQETEDTIEKINLVIFDINPNYLMINNQPFQVKVFSEEEVDLWFDNITSGIINIYLFISNIISNIFLRSICEYPQITSVYIFCKDKQYQNYSNSEVKLRAIFYDFDTMFKQFQNDINGQKNQYYFKQRSVRTIKPGETTILWWKLFVQVLENIHHTNIAKDEFIQFSRQSFRDDQDVLKQIERFEKTYTSDQAISWYTRNSFLYSFLNRTLRTENNLNNIFRLRFILTDIILQLKNIQLNLPYKIHPALTVYRGQGIPNEQMQDFKSAVGRLIFFDQFLSTSMIKEVALLFASSTLNNSFMQSVLFIINIDSFDVTNGQTLFANISSLSQHLQEKEVLFSIHSSFRIESVQLNEKNIWYIHLKSVDNLWDLDFGQKSIFSPHTDQIFIRNLSKENKQFIALQVLLDMILRLDQNKYAKQESLEYVRSKYQHDQAELTKIDVFERDYQSENAAYWYTNDNFLHRLLKESLRTENIDSIVKMRYYIYDLHNQLAQLQHNFTESLNEQQYLTLYRGQSMKKTQLNELRENFDGFISMNSFLSVTEDVDVAAFFSGDDQIKDPNIVAVVYEMLIDTNILSTPYAKIKKSKMRDEKEILFSMGCGFRIGEIYPLPNYNGIQCVKLKMEHIEDQLWNKLTDHLH